MLYLKKHKEGKDLNYSMYWNKQYHKGINSSQSDMKPQLKISYS